MAWTAIAAEPRQRAVVCFDSADIARFYLEEPDSTAISALATDSGNVHSSVLGKLEVHSVFHRKLREGAIDARGHSALARQFDADALHLASASEHGFREIHCNDRRMLAAAPLFEMVRELSGPRRNHA